MTRFGVNRFTGCEGDSPFRCAPDSGRKFKTSASAAMCHLLPNAPQQRVPYPITSSARTSSVWRQAERDSRNGTLWNIGSELLSLRLDVGRDNHLAPFFGLVGDELAEIGGRACEHRAA